MRLRKCEDEAGVLSASGMHCIGKQLIDGTDVFNKMKMVNVDFNENERRKYIADKIMSFGRDRTHKISVGYPSQHLVCRSCWCKYNGIGIKLAKKIENDLRNGKVDFSRQSRGIDKSARRKTSGEMCFLWLQNYARTRGDHMPDYEEIHLPDYRWRDVWKKYRTETFLMVDTCSPVSEHVFKQIREDLPYIKIRKVKRFAACKECSQFREQIGKTTGARRAELKMAFDRHIEHQFRERDKYYKHRYIFRCIIVFSNFYTHCAG